MRLSMLTCSLKLAISSLYPGGGAERCAAGASDRCIIAASAHTIHTHDAYSSTSSRAHFHTRIDTCAGTCADTRTETPVSAHRDTHVHARTQARVGKEVSESNVLLLCDISHTHAHLSSPQTTLALHRTDLVRDDHRHHAAAQDHNTSSHRARCHHSHAVALTALQTFPAAPK